MERSVLVAGFAAGSLATVLLVINNLRDVAGDRAVNKRTLAVRLGERFARGEVAFFAIAPFIAVVVLAYLRSQRFLLLPLLAAPLALALIVRVRRSSGRDLNRCLGMAGALQWIFGSLLVAGAVL